MNRILTWHQKEAVGNETRIGPTYYIEADYIKVAVRIYVVTAPTRDAKIDIFDDGVSIFNSRRYDSIDLTSGIRTVFTNETSVILVKGENADEIADDFSTKSIEEGSWVYCNLVDAGGGKDFTVQLELHQVSEDDEVDD